MDKTHTYELHKAGDKQTVNVISKNGVAMVAVSELAEVFGLNFDEGKTHIEFFYYVTQKQNTLFSKKHKILYYKRKERLKMKNIDYYVGK